MSNRERLRMLVVLACVGDLAGCATEGDPNKPAAVAELRPGLLVGYLPKESLPNSLALLPPPPAAGSAAWALDEEIARRSFALRETPRWALAASDAQLHFPEAAGTFSCALNAPITEADAPHLVVLLRRTLTDAGLSTYAAKDHFKRDRPFESNQAPICTPNEQAMLEKDGSYPSGHSAVGWAWALVLSEVSPERTDALLARGRAFGESRNVCNVHWHSDVVEGRLVGAGTVARLHSDPGFRADLIAAKIELAAVRAKGPALARDCAAEAAALAIGAPPRP